MVFGRIVGLMMGCLGMNCMRIADQPSPPPSETSSIESSADTAAATADTAAGGSLRVKLKDGRYLAYKERGVPKNKSNYRVIVVHGFASSKEMNIMAPQELMEELGIYLLLFDRAGYGESDPNRKRSLKSEAYDIVELADQLDLGPKFYVFAVSVGAYPAWSCLKRLPERLAGVAMVVPYVNYRWPSLPHDLIKDDYRKNLSRWMVWVARRAPGLLYWWLTQKMFPTSNVLDRNPKFFSNKDMEVLKNTPGYQIINQNKLKKPDVFDSMRRDFILAFGKWDFDPLQLSSPFAASSKCSVHIWQGYEDKVVPVQLQRHISKKLPWIKYHEVSDGGHLLVYDTAVCEAVLRSLLLGEDQPLYRPKCED